MRLLTGLIGLVVIALSQAASRIGASFDAPAGFVQLFGALSVIGLGILFGAIFFWLGPPRTTPIPWHVVSPTPPQIRHTPPRV